MRAWASAAALALGLAGRAAAQPEADPPRRSDGMLLAFRPLPAEAIGGPAPGLGGPAALDHFFDAMRPAPPLPAIPWRRPEPYAPKRRTAPDKATAPLRRSDGTEPVLLLVTPVETAGYRRTFRILMARPQTTDRYDSLVLRYGERHGLNPRLLKAIIAAESEFVERARSPKGALGLMQLAPATAGEMGVAAAALGDPESNIRAGASYLRHLFERAWRRYRLEPSLPFSRAPMWVVQRVIAAYNGGPSCLARERLFRETREYVLKVLLFLRSPVAVLRRHAPAPAEPPIVPPTIRPR